MSNGTTVWTVRYTATGHGAHYKVFHDQAAAEDFARWWEGRGEGFESLVLPAPRGDPPSAASTSAAS